MPWKSQAQRAWGHTAEGMVALGGPAKVAEWDAATGNADLPHRLAPPRLTGNSHVDGHRLRAYHFHRLHGGP